MCLCVPPKKPERKLLDLNNFLHKKLKINCLKNNKIAFIIHN